MHVKGSLVSKAIIAKFSLASRSWLARPRLIAMAMTETILLSSSPTFRSPSRLNLSPLVASSTLPTRSHDSIRSKSCAIPISAGSNTGICSPETLRAAIAPCAMSLARLGGRQAAPVCEDLTPAAPASGQAVDPEEVVTVPRAKEQNKVVTEDTIKLDEKPSLRAPRVKKSTANSRAVCQETNPKTKQASQALRKEPEVTISKFLEYETIMAKPKKMAPGKGKRKSEDALGLDDQTPMIKKPRAKKSVDETKNVVKSTKSKRHVHVVKDVFRIPPGFEHKFEVAVAEQVPQSTLVLPELDEDRALAEIAVRKTHWTPPHERIIHDVAEATCSDDEDVLPEVFKDMHSRFGHDNQNINATASKFPQLPSTTVSEGKTEEQVKVGDPLSRKPKPTPRQPRQPKPKAAPAPKKLRAPAKSSRTVTSIALAHYQPSEEPVTTETSGFFNPRAEQPEQNCVTIVPGKGLRERKALLPPLISADKPKTKRKPRAKNGNNATVPKLLSPEVAISKANKQEVMFGTSSQLARGESPSYVQDLQRAILASEAEARKQEDCHEWERVEDVLNTPSSCTAASKRKTSLWDAAARDGDDSLLAPESTQERNAFRPPSRIATRSLGEAEMQPRVEATQQARATQALHAVLGTTGDASSLKEEPADAPQDMERLDDVTPLLRMPLKAASRAKPKLLCLAAGSIAKTPSSTVVLQPSANKANLRLAQTIVTKNITAGDTCETTAPPKKRPGRPRKAVAPLVVTEEDNFILSTTGKTRTTTTLQPQPLTPQRHRKREKDWTHIDEIEDSEPTATPSPPRRHSPRAVSPLPLAAPPTTARSPAAPPRSPAAPLRARRTRRGAFDNLLDPACAAELGVLFAQITAAVRAQPRTRNPAKPSWREKMLLYDPIVLEHFAAWLNEGALAGVGRGEGEAPVREAVVRRWCDGYSVCCLYEEGSRGGVKEGKYVD